MLYIIISFLSYKMSKVMINWSVFLSSYQILTHTIYDDTETEIKYLFRRISFSKEFVISSFSQSWCYFSSLSSFFPFIHSDNKVLAINCW